MEQIALPDTTASFEPLKEILAKQGYELSKTAFDVQTVRLLDVFIVAPFLIYTGVKYNTLPKHVRGILIGLGAATLVYNGYNYLKNKK